MSIGKKIREYRSAKGFTQEALAGMLSVSPQTVSKWERGENIPDVEMLCRIADVFCVSLDLLAERMVMDHVSVANSMQGFYNSQEGKASRVHTTRKLAYTAELISYFGIGGAINIDNYVESHNVDHVTGSLCNEYNEGFALGSNHEECAFVSIFEESKDGYGQVFDEWGDYKGIFEALADKDAVKILHALYRKKDGFTFDDEWARINFGENAVETLEKLTALRILPTTYTVVDGIEVRLWVFNRRCAVVGMLVMAYALKKYHSIFDLNSDNRDIPYVR